MRQIIIRQVLHLQVFETEKNKKVGSEFSVASFVFSNCLMRSSKVFAKCSLKLCFKYLSFTLNSH